MMQLQEFRNRRLSTVLVQCLVVLFFFQALLPMQAHSRVARNDDGIAVVICTLQGEKTVMLELDGQQHENRHVSPAMLFSDLLNDLASTHVALEPPTLVLGRSQTVQQDLAHVAALATIESHSRAPPPA